MKKVILLTAVLLLAFTGTALALNEGSAKNISLQAGLLSASCGHGGWKCGAAVVECNGPYRGTAQWHCKVYILRWGHRKSQGCAVVTSLSAYGNILGIDIGCNDTAAGYPLFVLASP